MALLAFVFMLTDTLLNFAKFRPCLSHEAARLIAAEAELRVIPNGILSYPAQTFNQPIL
jgi:hypothetical protein